MTMKRYLQVTAVVTAIWVIALLAIPPFAQFVESLMLLFLSTTAR